MNFTYSNHAFQQMELRGISQETVELVVDKPDQVLQEGDLFVYQKIVTIDKTRKYIIRVFVNQYRMPPVVVTVYKSSKISKYYEGEI